MKTLEDIKQKISELLRLSPDWLEPGQGCINEDAVKDAHRWLDHFSHIDYWKGEYIPRVYPSLSNGVRLEWTFNGRDLEVEFNGGNYFIFLAHDRFAEKEPTVWELCVDSNHEAARLINWLSGNWTPCGKTPVHLR